MQCKECNKLLIGRQRYFCSNSCKSKPLGRKSGGLNNQRIKLSCIRCSKYYEKPPSQAIFSKYCSRLCQNRTQSDNMNRTGENNPMWKGDKVGYNGMHGWHLKHWVKSEICDFCKKQKKTDWAHKKGTKMTRDDRSCWLELCRSCHTTYDGKIRNIKKMRVYVQQRTSVPFP